MNLFKHPGGSLLDNLPLLTQLADEDEPTILPTLTEVVGTPAASVPPAPAPPPPVDEKLLLKCLEMHLEKVFSTKLERILAQLQSQAIEQAIDELKAELPELLRGALKARL